MRQASPAQGTPFRMSLLELLFSCLDSEWPSVMMGGPGSAQAARVGSEMCGQSLASAWTLEEEGEGNVIRTAAIVV